MRCLQYHEKSNLNMIMLLLQIEFPVLKSSRFASGIQEMRKSPFHSTMSVPRKEIITVQGRFVQLLFINDESYDHSLLEF